MGVSSENFVMYEELILERWKSTKLNLVQGISPMGGHKKNILGIWYL